ncbi:MAG: hypothetical protein II690_05460 [Ruminococcus sp.]|nr:hypothetical protein [Ruminococcus sp.]
MTDKEIFDVLTDCSDETLEQLAEVNRLTARETERILKGSEMKYVRKYDGEVFNDTVENVENYRPRRVFAGLAAGLVCVAGLTAGAWAMLKNPPDIEDIASDTAENVTDEQVMTVQVLDSAELLGVEMQVSGATAEGAIISLKRDPECYKEEISTSSYYRVEKSTGDSWEEVPEIIDNAAFTSEARDVSSDWYGDEAVNWVWRYGELPPGDYRLVKELSFDGGNMCYIYADFTVSEELPVLVDMPIPEEFAGKHIQEIGAIYDYAFDLSDMQELFSRAGNVVVGVVENLEYTCVSDSISGGTPYTKVHITVTEDFAGICDPGQQAAISFVGGYLSMREKYGDMLYASGGKYGDGINITEEEIDNSVFYEKHFSGQMPVIGQEYAFIVTNESEPGNLWSLGEEYSVFRRTGRNFTRRVDDRNEVYSASELQGWFENKGSPYFDEVTYDGNCYSYHGRQYSCKYTLTGRLPSAASESSVTFLTNCGDYLFLDVNMKILSSDISDQDETDTALIFIR